MRRTKTMLMGDLLEEFLDLARPRPPERWPCDLRGVCEYVCRTQQPVAEAAGVAEACRGQALEVLPGDPVGHHVACHLAAVRGHA